MLDFSQEMKVTKALMAAKNKNNHCRRICRINIPVIAKLGIIGTFAAISFISMMPTTLAANIADPDLSTVEIRNPFIEPIHSATYDFSKYSGYNAAYLKIVARDGGSLVLPSRQVYLNQEITNNFIVHQVDCDNPVQTISANDETDSFGRACFLIYKDAGLSGSSGTTPITVAVDETEGPNTTLNSHPTVTTASLANLNLYNYRFRNDDGNELTATPVDDTNTPYYNLNPADHFRLRMNISRVNNFDIFADPRLNKLAENSDELAPLANADIGPRPLPTYQSTQDFRAFQSMAINTTTHTLYIPTADYNGAGIRFYKYDSNNISQSPTYFDIAVNGGVIGENITNIFIDSTNNLMYFILSPISSGADAVKIYKVNLTTETVINILTQPTGTTFRPVSQDAEIDLTNGFLYVTLSGSIEGEAANYARLLKIKLNGPTQNTTRIGELKIAKTADPINASIIDITNQYLYLAYGTTYSKIMKVDLNVDPSLPPVRVKEISLVANPDQSPSQMVGPQSAVIDTVNGYAYFGSSTDPGLEQSSTLSKAYITKVDIDPNRTFEVAARLQTSDPSFSTTDTLSGAEFFNFASNQNVGTTAQIDVANQYAYFIASHQNFSIGFPVYKIYRIDLTDFSHDDAYDELNYPSPNTQSIKANLLIPSLGQGFIIRNHSDGDQITSYSTATRNTLRLQSAPNIDAEYCNQANDSNYTWSNVPNDDFTLQASDNITDGNPTSNVSGLLSENNEAFIPGTVQESAAVTSTILLGRRNFTEVEYSLKATAGAKGSYCFRMIDNDSQNDHQTGNNANYISGREPADFSPQHTNYYAPLSIDGAILDKSTVNMIEGVSTNTFGIKLASAPTDNVTITIIADDNRIKLSPDSTPASPTSTAVIFTTQNWDTYQYITTTAPVNATVDGTTTALIHLTATSTDPAYNNIFIRPLTSSITDYGATSTDIIANVTGEVLMTPPESFAFPQASSGQNTPNFSPGLTLSVDESRGTAADYTVTLQAGDFCSIDNVCIPLNKIYLASSDLVNSLNTYNASQIGQFLANYLQNSQSLSDRSTYVHTDAADDRKLSSPITLIDTRNVPSGSSENPLQGALTTTLHLMIDYANISALPMGEYTTALTFDLNPTP